MLTATAALFLLCMILAIVSDIRSMTIPNRLCLLLAAGFAVAAPLSGMAPAMIGLHAATALLLLLACMGLFALGAMGGGDAKLIAATALWFGPSVALMHYLLLASVLGGVLTLLLLSARAVFRPASGIGFVDRLLSPAEGIPYGVALGLAGAFAFLRVDWMNAAASLATL